jgi:ABC-type dipeptide/oligopeptide/nickel transport system ATPase component
LLTVCDLCVEFQRPGAPPVTAVDHVSFDVGPGEIVGLVGESSAGKSVTVLSLLDLVPSPGAIVGGEVRWHGRDLRALSPRERHRVRGRGMALVAQNAQSALVPVQTVARQLRAVLATHTTLRGRSLDEECLRLLHMVQLDDPERVLGSYAHQLSGGMCQRVGIALALACKPELLIADEATASVDVTTQAELIRLLRELRARLSMAILFVSHDLGAVSQLCDRVVVMRQGRIMESSTVGEIFSSPRHPYTRLLLDSIPVPVSLYRMRHLTDQTTDANLAPQ